MHALKQYSKDPCLWLVVFFSLFSLMAEAQEEIDLRLTAKPIGIVWQSAHQYRGSEFLFGDWMPGEIQLANDQIVKNLQLNYSAYSDALIYAAGGMTPVETSKYHVKAFRVNTDKGERFFILSDLDTKLSSEAGGLHYYEVLFEGSSRLYVQRSLKINKSLVSDNPFKKSVYYADDKYLVNIRGNWITRPQKPVSYYRYYEKSMVKNIIREHKLSLKDEEDLVRFLTELDQLDLVLPAPKASKPDKP